MIVSSCVGNLDRIVDTLAVFRRVSAFYGRGGASLLLACLLVACGGSDGPTSSDTDLALPLRAVLYVSPSGDDLGAGTRMAPFRSIQRAIDAAVGLTDVRVSEGQYNEAVRLKPHVSVLGGYKAADWDVRDPRLYVSKISGGSLGTATVVIPADVTSTTVLSGTTIIGTAFISSSTALSVSNGARPVVSGNTLVSGSGMSAVGISLTGSGATVANNIVYGNLASSVGILVSGTSSDLILNNTISVSAFGVAGVACGISIESVATPGLEISNNIIIVTGGVRRCGITSSPLDAVVVRNNDFVVGDDSGGSYVGTAGNIAVDPMLENFRIGLASPAVVKFGGMSLTAVPTFPRNIEGVPVDIDARGRTDPWSMGANEMDE